MYCVETDAVCRSSNNPFRRWDFHVLHGIEIIFTGFAIFFVIYYVVIYSTCLCAEPIIKHLEKAAGIFSVNFVSLKVRCNTDSTYTKEMTKVAYI